MRRQLPGFFPLLALPLIPLIFGLACCSSPCSLSFLLFLRKGSRGGPSRRGVALLRPEPLHRGTADTFLNRVKKLPCQITRWETGEACWGYRPRPLGRELGRRVAAVCRVQCCMRCLVGKGSARSGLQGSTWRARGRVRLRMPSSRQLEGQQALQ